MTGTAPAPGTAVAEGVGRIPGFVNAYTFADGEETVLIDTGFNRRARSIVRAFGAAGVPLDRVRKVLLTHHHVDHMGGAAFLREATGAPLACHPEDTPLVDGRARARMPLLLRLFVRVHPAPVAVALHDGDRVGSLEVVHTPGHTPGEVVLFDRSRKILFSGDAVVHRKGRLTLPGRRYASDLGQAIRSLARVRALAPEILLPGHGEPVTHDVVAQLDELIRRAPTEFARQLRRR
ncbi:MAG TPA: MBL fold metallo-hydrolase [Thermoplasmata archaeon]|nr:MBL fold metallo-hydrolase [Thermoplasmata archaeon]